VFANRDEKRKAHRKTHLESLLDEFLPEILGVGMGAGGKVDEDGTVGPCRPTCQRGSHDLVGEIPVAVS